MPQRPLDPDDPTSSIFTIRLPKKVVERIRREARQAGESQSVYVRRLLDANMTAEAAKAKPPSSRESEAVLRQEIERLRRTIAALEQARIRSESAAKTKATKAALDPESAAAKEIARLKTRVRNLTLELRDTRDFNEAVRNGGVTFAGYKKIVKCLHPDTRARATEADKDEACGLLSQWKQTGDRKRRK